MIANSGKTSNHFKFLVIRSLLFISFSRWIEGWERKRRQYICDVDSTDCIGSDDDLRNAICEKNFNSVIENLKSDIECGWGASGKTQSHLLLTFAFSTFIIWGKLI